MSVGKHTKGPWAASGLSVRCAEGARENTSICICTPNFRDDGSPYDNAHLIAAAPDYHGIAKDAAVILSAVLEDREESIGEEDEVLRDLIGRIRAAIAKAEGRSDA